MPSTPVPELTGLASALLPVADFFMVAMLSRPATGSLRSTWVTPATFWMCVGVVIIGCAAAVLLVLFRLSVVTALSALILLTLALGAVAVALVGRAQQHQLRRM